MNWDQLIYFIPYPTPNNMSEEQFRERYVMEIEQHIVNKCCRLEFETIDGVNNVTIISMTS